MTTKIERLGRRFGDFQALKQIDLEIKDGEFVAVLGPSGCGKTTLLRLLAGFDTPTRGVIQMNGRTVANSKSVIPPEKRNIGMVFQSFALWPHMNVAEHIRFPLQHHQFVSPELKKNAGDRVKEVLDIVALGEFAERMPNELSGGQKQRVALGRAIAPKPDLLLMDEPLSSLDAELRMDMRSEIQGIHRRTGASIVYVTHDQSEALAMADRIVVMNRGAIEQAETPWMIYHQPKTEFVAHFVGKSNLVRGKWRDGTFSPDVAEALDWQDQGVSDELKQKNIFPVRPEQFDIGLDQNGVPGIISSVQFQGKEIHYTVQVSGAAWQVITDVFHRYRLGQQVFVRIKKERMRDKPIDRDISFR
ncbi:ABC transporter ATP-binding protein [Sporolactobacillus sp. THM7-7]|nr:ABC transporter ATP-binding protein [Sporolactobacillus sp. THM7-7]